jgi:Uma2 family endonuclease
MSTSTATKMARTPLTYEDYLTFPDQDRIRKEIIDGELVMSPSPTLKHQAIIGNLFVLLHNFIKKNKLGKIFFAPCDVILSDINIVQPDIIFISKENFEVLTDLNVRGEPDLIIEILSPSTAKMDRIFKKSLYERFGVKEYWIIDPSEEIIEIWLLKNEQYQLSSTFHKNQILISQMFTGLEINLSEIF